MHVRPNFTSVASEPVDRIYLEKVTGFSSTSQRKINAIGKFAGSQNQVTFLNTQNWQAKTYLFYRYEMK